MRYVKIFVTLITLNDFLSNHNIAYDHDTTAQNLRDLTGVTV